MAKKEFSYRGKTLDELKKMTLEELAQYLPAPSRRKIRRGFTDAEKLFLKSFRAHKGDIKTHCRDMLVLPEMVGASIKVYSGREFVHLPIVAEMIGHRFGEFVLTRKRVQHNAPGIGATRSSSAVSVK
ncbi:30S ribosomal protein S19 [Candidatus Woesearchaeota archaeon]|nr:30S ribosomal protein S19 [Candidatus Woesearchaeota archaeon]